MWLCIAKKSISASSVGMSRSPPAHITVTILRIDRCQGFTLAPLTRYSSRPATDIAAGSKNWSDARAAEGAPLLREYRVKSSIEGSNPSRSASVLDARKLLICGRFYLWSVFIERAILPERVAGAAARSMVGFLRYSWDVLKPAMQARPWAHPGQQRSGRQ
ncbi:hypothetical protein XAP6164_870008 [Xanthomonas phaseoli pv. phaseoli]|nr:hypothetical protein XAP6164_870008 [Xanthomonas phaseoli pv. phaseoli]